MRIRRGLKPAKFAFFDELRDYATRGQSLIIYHHADRSEGGIEAQVPRRLWELGDAVGLSPLGAVVVHRSGCRFLLVAPTPEHRDLLADGLAAFARKWAPHVELQLLSGF